MAGGVGAVRARWPSFGLTRTGRDRGRLLSPNVARMSAAILALIVMSVAAAAGYVYQLRASAAVQHTVEVDNALARIYSTIQDAETGQRGYLLTGDESFLQPYTRAEGRIAKRLATLRELVADNDKQLVDVAELEALVTAKLAELQGTIDLRRRGETDRSKAVVGAGAGRSLMDSIRARVDLMEQREAGLLEERQATVSRVALAVWAVAAGLVALLVAVSVSGIREASRRASLARFLPAEVADRLADDDDTLREGRRQDAAIAFVDMRDSTALAEGLDPKEISEFLTAFRTRLTRAARMNGGVIDKFLGDGALVVFGLPSPRDDDAARALRFARDLDLAIARWNAARGDGRTVRIGVGIHYGTVFCGVVGREDRLEFTVLGDTVNVAARLEQATKAHGVTMIASRAACEAAGCADQGWREIGHAPLRGRRTPLPYCAPTGAADPSAARTGEPVGSGGALREK
jgi:adenylate cyclase